MWLMAVSESGCKASFEALKHIWLEIDFKLKLILNLVSFNTKCNN